MRSNEEIKCDKCNGNIEKDISTVQVDYSSDYVTMNNVPVKFCTGCGNKIIEQSAITSIQELFGLEAKIKIK